MFELSANAINTQNAVSNQRLPFWLINISKDVAPHNMQTELNFCLDTLSPIQPMVGLEAMVLKARTVTNSEAINKLDSSDL